MVEVIEQIQAVLGERYTIEREIGRGGMATVYLRGSRVVQGKDVRVGEPGGDLDLPEKTLRPQGVGQLGLEYLDRHLPLVLDVPREVDRGHAPGTKLPLDVVFVLESNLEVF